MNTGAYEVGKQLRLVVEKLVSGGDGMSRLPDGRVIFIPGALPREELLVRITENRRDFARAQVVQVLSPSPLRGEPKCPYYTLCGGCDLQHVRDEQQPVIKRQIFLDTMIRTGSIDVERLGDGFSFISGQMWEYRTRAKFHVDPRRNAVGFLGRNSSQVVDIVRCPILDPRLNHLLDSQRAHWLEHPQRPAPPKRKKRFQKPGHPSVQAVVTDDGAVTGRHTGVQTIRTEGTGEKTFFLDAEVFFQSNQRMFTRLLDTELASLQGSKAMDLFSGVGTFAAFLQDRFDTITAVERDPGCLQFARENLDQRHVTFYEDAVEHWVQGKGAFGMDLIVVDPPRTGLPPTVIDIMLSWKPAKVLYVSCNPVTLARDLKIITGRGYSIRTLHAYDFYPQTTHMEAAALLVRDFIV
jgi:23S rRNA (uracil1939-C5)-methyltransferase